MGSHQRPSSYCMMHQGLDREVLGQEASGQEAWVQVASGRVALDRDLEEEHPLKHEDFIFSK